MFRRFALAATLALVAAPTIASAQDMNPNVHARQAFMDLQAYNLGPLGGMAQGRIPYDAAVAQAAATNLYHLSRVDIAGMFVAGTDNASMQGTRALPAIWSDMAGFEARIEALRGATEAMMNAAGTDLASLQGAMGALGGACGGCHQTFRQPQ